MVGKICEIQNNTMSPKLILVTDIPIPRKLMTIISVASTHLDTFVLFCISEILPPLSSLKRLKGCSEILSNSPTIIPQVINDVYRWYKTWGFLDNNGR